MTPKEVAFCDRVDLVDLVDGETVIMCYTPVWSARYDTVTIRRTPKRVRYTSGKEPSRAIPSHATFYRVTEAYQTYLRRRRFRADLVAALVSRDVDEHTPEVWAALEALGAALNAAVETKTP